MGARLWVRGTAAVLAFLLGFWPGSVLARADGQDPCPPLPPVVVDPGHGGVDGGASVGGVLEKNLTLAIAQRMVTALTLRKIPAVLTRESDQDMGGPLGTKGRHRRDLAARVERVRACKGAMLLSLHVNVARHGEQRGYVLFYQAKQPLSRDLAGLIDLQFAAAGLRRAEPLLTRDFHVLRRSPAPAVLVELGFLTNEEERRRLQEPAYQQRLADLLANACALAYHAWFPPLPAGKQYSSARSHIY